MLERETQTQKTWLKFYPKKGFFVQKESTFPSLLRERERESMPRTKQPVLKLRFALRNDSLRALGMGEEQRVNQKNNCMAYRHLNGGRLGGGNVKCCCLEVEQE